jgi:hypothetical protein
LARGASTRRKAADPKADGSIILPSSLYAVEPVGTPTLLLLGCLQGQQFQYLILEMGRHRHLFLGFMEQIQESLLQLEVGITPFTHGEVVLDVPVGRSIQLPIQILVDLFQGLAARDGATVRTLLFRLSRTVLMVALTGK